MKLINILCRSIANLPFQCPECFQRFPTEVKLQKHSKNKWILCHRLKCAFCEKKFCSNRKLDAHKKTHSTEARNDEVDDFIEVPNPSENMAEVDILNYNDEYINLVIT